MSANAGTDVVVIGNEEAALILTGQLEVPTVAIEDPQEVQRRIIGQILEAEDEDAVFGGTTAVGGKEILGRPFTLKAVRWLRSSFTEGENALPLFALLEADMLDDGTSLVVTTGAANVMAQALKLAELGSFPVDVKLMEAEKATASGYRVQFLTRA